MIMIFTVIAESLDKSVAKVGEIKEPLIERAHIMESVIDVVKLNGLLSVEWKRKLIDSPGIDLFLTSCSTIDWLYARFC